MQGLQSAELDARLGDIPVSFARVDLDGASTATYDTTGNVSAIVSPRSESDVQVAVGVLGDLKLPFHCRSGQANWGYGSRNARHHDSVLISLADMKSITILDRELGLIQIEPGVSVVELQHFLRVHLPQFVVSGPASSPDASVVGNLLARGIGSGIDAHRSKHLLSVRAVLPNGDVVDTAPASGTKLACHTAVLGPDAGPLFLQSSLGIVTSIRMRLHRPLPQSWVYGTGFPRQALQRYLGDIAELVESAPRTTAAVFGPGRLALESGRFADSKEWTLAVNFEARSWGSSVQSILRLLSTFGFGIPQRIDPSSTMTSRSDLNILYGPYGAPDRRDRNPDLDGVGLIFANSIVPLHPDQLDAQIRELEEIFDAHRLPLALSIRFIGAHDARLIVPIVWARDDLQSEATAMATYKAVQLWQVRNGARPYRLSTLDASANGPNPFIRLLKQAVDPDGLLDGDLEEPTLFHDHPAEMSLS